MALVGFARVSTNEQDLKIQIDKLTDHGCIKVFQHKHSGKKETNQAALAELLDYVRENDTVVVTKLDRLGRSLSQVLQVIDELNAKKVTLVTLDQKIDTANDDPMNKAMVQLLGMFAELERNFIVSRTQEGKEKSGNYGGRKPKLTKEQRQEIKSKLSQGVSKVKLSAEYNVTRSTILNIEREG